MRGTPVFVLMLVLVLALTSAAPALATSTTETSKKTHTLVIEQKSGSVGYTVTVSGTITIKGNETGDSITGQTAGGRVGGLPWKESANDTKDVIRFTGQLQHFEYDGGEIRVTLDGKQIDPNALVGTPPPPPPTPTKTSPSPTTTSTPTTSTPTTSTPTSTPTTTPTTMTPSQSTSTVSSPPPPQTTATQSTRASPSSSDGGGSGWSLFDIVLAIGVAVVVLRVFLRRL